MKKFWNILKLIGIFICFVLLLAFLFFNIIDWIIPGDFPDWVFVTHLAAWAVIGVLALADFIKKCCQRNKVKKRSYLPNTPWGTPMCRSVSQPPTAFSEKRSLWKDRL